MKKDYLNIELLKRAERGDAAAMLVYGAILSYKEDVDVNQAINWFESAGEHGLLIGFFLAAMLIAKEKPEDLDRAICLMEKASKDGDAQAMGMVGMLIESDCNRRDAVKLASEWYRKAAFDDVTSAMRLFELIDAGTISEEEVLPLTVVDILKMSAFSGDSHAAFCLSNEYREGKRLTSDAKLSKHWLEVSAALGNAMAHRLLAMSYSLGINGFSNNPAAEKFHEKRAEEIDRVERIEGRHKTKKL